MILGERYEEYLFWLNLPSSADFIGSVLNLYDSPIRTRSAANLILATDDPQSGIVTTLKRGLYGFEPVPRIEAYDLSRQVHVARNVSIHDRIQNLRSINTMAETTIEGITLSQLPKVTTLAANDLIEIDRNGTGAAVSYVNLVEAMADSLGLAGVAEALEQIIG